MSHEIRHSVKKENIRNILEFLPVFESLRFEFGEWIPAEKGEDGIIHFGWYCLSSKSIEFMEALYLERNSPEYTSHRTPLYKEVTPEPADALKAE